MSQVTTSAPVAICVLGMHRSGTSALARLINLLGVDLSPELLGGSVDNPKGFWEQRQILEAHADLLDTLGSFFDDFLPLSAGWQSRTDVIPHRDRLLDILRTNFGGKPLWGFKDPRTCRLLPLWHDLFTMLGVGSRFALMVRNPDEIARSLAVRNGYSYNKSLLLTLVHMLEAELHTRGRARVIVTYDEILADWQTTAAKIATSLALQWPNSCESAARETSEFLDPHLRHHKADKVTTAEQAVALHGADPDAARWTFAIYDLLAAAKDSGAIDTNAIDCVYAEFRESLPRLSAWRQVRSIDQKYMQVEAWGVRLDATVKHLAKDNQELRLELARRSSANPLDGTAAGVNRVLEDATKAANGEIAVLREVIAEREAQIVQLQTRQHELELAHKWLVSEKQAADQEIERRGILLKKQDAASQARSGELETEYAGLRTWISELTAGRDFLAGENRRLAEATRKLEAENARLLAGIGNNRMG